MLVKKSGGKRYGAQFNKNEQKAIDIELCKIAAEYNRANANEIDAMVLWILHQEFGFGPSRLRRFHKLFQDGIENLARHYEMDAVIDAPWLCNHKLKEYGVDIEAWNKEKQ